jgi:hypothetical protein
MVYSPGDDESRDRRAEVGSRVVPELGDERVSLERRLNEAALNTAASPVHEAHLAQPCLGRGVYVVCDDASDIPRGEGVQVYLGFDGDADWGVRHRKCKMQNAKCQMYLRNA